MTLLHNGSPLGPTILAALLVGSSAGCVSDPAFGGDPSLAVQKFERLPHPITFDPDYERYVVGPNDTLSIGVFGIEGLEEREVRADPSGRVSFPLAGSIDASGMTLSELEEALKERFRASHIKNPRVTVNLKDAISRTVTVEGQVVKPGSFAVTNNMTLLRAVANAGSTTEFARLQDVVIFREVDGQRYAGLYNLEAIRLGAYPDPEVFADDLIVVGDSPARRRFNDLIQLAPLISTPIIVLLQNL